MLLLIYELRENWRGTGGRVEIDALQDVLADLKRDGSSIDNAQIVIFLSFVAGLIYRIVAYVANS